MELWNTMNFKPSKSSLAVSNGLHPFQLTVFKLLCEVVRSPLMPSGR